MAFIFICSICKKETSEKVEACPNCGANIWEAGTIKTTFNNEKVKNRKGGWIIAIMIILCIIWLLPINDSSPDRIKNTSKDSHSSVEAAHICQQFVRERLLSPRTANFPSLVATSRHTTDLEGGRYRISSYVDAQNAFGAEVRTQFICTVKYEGEWNWRLENLDM
ncbi:Uncharacterised protein [Vibrio metschnikovii]|uniref:hypothetical protein n=1 Tax=Vibrio metschnikovii TaxID=28172 RepID=UPI000594B81F|nr:hypothetical protein [Vibrio metschnikovii]MBC3621890.1 hypothetical protein [Vibrio metschnikovii]SUP49854.1 Uncharacterised protein [Vibrio metschnikovii]SUQ10252.1 Uncharacterised protein [Vibrio metschnikovii]